MDSSNKTINKGHLLSPRDLCGIEYLIDFVQAGVKCLKIEGRLKSPEYVAVTTKIYRKYLDLAINDVNKNTNEQNGTVVSQDTGIPTNGAPTEHNSNSQDLLEDKQQLMQVFNRGGFSDGHLNSHPNTNLIYKQKPNHIGLPIGKIISYNTKKGYIKLKLENSISIGDSIQVEKENNNYNVSELLLNNLNIKTANIGDIVEIGRLKGNISSNDKVFKTVDKALFTEAQKTFSSAEYKKVPICGSIIVKENSPILFNVTCSEGIYDGCSINLKSDVLPVQAKNSPITKDRIIAQLSKTGNTEFEFESINVDLADNLFIPSICLNDLRRTAIEKLEEFAKGKYKKAFAGAGRHKADPYKTQQNILHASKYCALLNNLDLDVDYFNLDLDRLYIPFKYFTNDRYSNLLKQLCNTYEVYIYMPTIIRNNYLKYMSNLDEIVSTYNINGFVISHISQLKFVIKYNLKIIGNYTLNVMNLQTVSILQNLGLDTVTISPELDKLTIIDMVNNFNKVNSELIVYGKLPLMTSNYCLISNTNHCLPSCNKNCEKQSYYLKDRLGFLFKIAPDNIDTVTTIYNSKITSISSVDFNLNYIRMDFLDESIDEIKSVINTVKTGNRLEGKDYTNGNINRLV